MSKRRRHLRAAGAPKSRSARAITLLEVVLAVVLMGLVTASVTGAISAVEGMDHRSRQRLAAHELANRLVLMYLDDPDSMPSEVLPLEYGPWRFLWTMREDSVSMRISDAQRRSGSSPQALDRFGQITVAVFSTDESGDYPVRDEQMAAIVRLFDPAAPRNPDSAMHTFSNPDNIAKLIKKITDGAVDPNAGAPPIPREGKPK